jgi:hypothetical protein
VIGGPHYISHEDEVGVVVVGGRVNMRDGPIRLFNGIELGLRNVTGEGVRTGVLLGLSEGVIEIVPRGCESACHW